MDRYSRIDSIIRRISSATKTVVMFTGVLATIVVPIQHWAFFIAVILFYFCVLQLSKIPSLFILKRLLLTEPFIVGVAFLSLFKEGGGVTFLTLVLKSSLSVFGMILYSNTTPFSEVLHLLKRYRCPALLVTILALMYRYLFVLIDETERMQRARASRTFTTSQFHIWRVRSSIIAQLFVRSTERADRIYAAMRARGWK